jgi:hypothetical protein
VQHDTPEFDEADYAVLTNSISPFTAVQNEFIMA